MTVDHKNRCSHPFGTQAQTASLMKFKGIFFITVIQFQEAQKSPSRRGGLSRDRNQRLKGFEIDRRTPPTRHPRPVDHPQRTAEDQQQPSRTGTPTRRIYRTHIRGEHAFPLHNHTQRRKHELISTRNQNRQLKSLAELSQLIRVKAQHIDRLPLHQLLSTINQAINLTSSASKLSLHPLD
ncbi:uncharacterized protein VP01_807g1 [Puccinia sorghi]|uniref:Uncharacterized protein n=1 Tax=Puccinia sorghi TaxID=27349 RepID=A0A0L6UAD6_9BASI|nr:uncharacterized protein VP01_807g1 [Puccinia sorghi]